jgi:thiosulfate dehydrogenase [quinone] large subunit
MSSPNSGSLDESLAYASLRAILGLNIFLHGVVRLPTLSGFAEGLVSAFADTILPDVLVRLFAYGLVPAEAIIGLLLLIGWRTRGALVAGQAVMAALVFGTALRQEWGTLGTQMIYVSIYAALLFLRRYDGYGVDAWLGRE